MTGNERQHGIGQTFLSLTDANFEELVLESSMPVLVAFCSSQCRPSQKLEAVLNRLATDYDTRVRIGRFEMEDTAAIPTRYGVQATPALLLFKEGASTERIVGAPPEAWLREKLDANLGNQS